MKKLLVLLAAIAVAVVYSSCETTSGDHGKNRHSDGHSRHLNPL